MKKVFLLAATLIAAWSCETVDTDAIVPSGSTDSDVISITVGAPQSRVTFTEDSGDLSAKWVEDDALGAWSSGLNSFEKFSMVEGSMSADSATATFSGSGITSGDLFCLVHPYVKTAISNSKFEIDLTAQTADMDNDGFDNIGASTYMISGQINDSSSSIVLSHLGALLNIQMRFEGLTASDLTIKSLTISDAASGATEANLATSVEYVITDTTSEDIVVTVTNSPEISNYSDDRETYSVKCNVLPFSVAADGSISVEVTLSDGSSTVVEVPNTSADSFAFARATYTTLNLSCDMTPVIKYDYSIGSESDLAIFRDAVNAGQTTLNAQLTAGFTLEVDDWEPIGTEDNPYAGTFDGAGYTISNLNVNAICQTNSGADLSMGFSGNSNTVNASDGYYTLAESPYINNVGFFGRTNGATVKNLTIDGGYVLGSIYVGGIIGYATDTKIINCTGAVDCQAYSEYAGTIAGYAKGCTVIACVGTAQAHATGKAIDDLVASTYKDAAGLICYVDDCDIIGCYSIGAVRSTGSGTGGLVGTLINDCKVSGSYAAAAVNKSGNYGFADSSTGTTFNAAYWVSDIENLRLDNYNDTYSTYDKATNTINTTVDNEGSVASITAETLNTSDTVDALNAAITAAGVSEYKFQEGTDTAYPVIVKTLD